MSKGVRGMQLPLTLCISKFPATGPKYRDRVAHCVNDPPSLPFSLSCEVLLSSEGELRACLF